MNISNEKDIGLKKRRALINSTEEVNPIPLQKKTFLCFNMAVFLDLAPCSVA